jgi:hypothetical protein
MIYNVINYHKLFKGFIMEMDWIYVIIGIVVLVGLVVVDIVLDVDSYAGKIYTKIANFMGSRSKNKKE